MMKGGIYLTFVFWLSTFCISKSLGNNITIRGKLEDCYFSVIELKKYDFFLQRNSLYEEATILKDSTFVFRLSQNKPTFVSLLNNLIWITPGDSVYLVCSLNEIISCTGSNSGNYIIASKIKNRYTLPILSKNNDLFDFVENIELIFEKRFNYMKELFKRIETTPCFQINLFKELQFELIGNKLGLALVDESLEDLLLKKMNLTEDTFNDEDGFNTISFGTALSFFYLIRSKSLLVNALNDKIKLDIECKFIDDHYSARSNEALKVFVLKKYVLGISETFYAAVDSILQIENIRIKHPVYKGELENIYNLFHLTNASVPDNVLSSEIIDINNKSISIKDLFSLHEGKAIVFDFWATWCEPCRGENVFLNDLREKIDSSKVVFISISIDDNFAKWEKGLVNHFFNRMTYFIGNKQSALLRYLKVTSIPRYVIFNKNKNLALFKAPRPSNQNKLYEIINEIINQ